MRSQPFQKGLSSYLPFRKKGCCKSWDYYSLLVSSPGLLEAMIPSKHDEGSLIYCCDYKKALNKPGICFPLILGSFFPVLLEGLNSSSERRARRAPSDRGGGSERSALRDRVERPKLARRAPGVTEQRARSERARRAPGAKERSGRSEGAERPEQGSEALGAPGASVPQGLLNAITYLLIFLPTFSIYLPIPTYLLTYYLLTYVLTYPPTWWGKNKNKIRRIKTAG